MDYRKIGENYYIRMDRGDEIITNLLKICEQESIPSAVFSGIGGCQSAELPAPAARHPLHSCSLPRADNPARTQE